MKSLLTAVLMLGVLAGCTMTNDEALALRAAYEKNLATWIGSQESQLVDSWGPPTRVYQLDGSKYLTYWSRSNPGCEDIFKVTGGIVEQASFKGIDCYLYSRFD